MCCKKSEFVVCPRQGKSEKEISDCFIGRNGQLALEKCPVPCAMPTGLQEEEKGGGQNKGCNNVFLI